MIVIYGHENCKWCKVAVQFADKNGLNYVYKDVIANPDYLLELQKRVPGVNSVPLIFSVEDGNPDNYTLIGTYSDFVRECGGN